MLSSWTSWDTAGMRILVVEDDPTLGKVLNRALSEEGYAVDVAPTYHGAIEHLMVNEYDLLVVDVGLPDGDGLSLCRAVRAGNDGLPVDAPILLLTARDGLSDKVAGLDSGADDYLTKPFAYPELAARVRALLRRNPARHQPVLESGDVRLDPASHTVWRGAIMIPLTPREFGLLDYLLRHPGEVVSREALLEHVWDAHYDGLSNVVDVHVANLRRKLTFPDSPAPIETVRGVGFRMTP